MTKMPTKPARPTKTAKTVESGMDKSKPPKKLVKRKVQPRPETLAKRAAEAAKANLARRALRAEVNDPFHDSDYEFILAELTEGAFLKDLVGVPDEPSYAQLRRWARRRNREDELKLAISDGLAKRALDAEQIAGDHTRDLLAIMDDETGKVLRYVANPARLARDTLHIKTTHWLASRLNKDFSEKTQQEIGNLNGAPLLVIGDTKQAAEVARARIAARALSADKEKSE